jgi:hypothetical protein
MAATIRAVEKVAAAGLALPCESVALRRGPPTSHHRGMPTGDVRRVFATKILAQM